MTYKAQLFRYHRHWTDREDKTLRTLFGTMRTKLVAQKLGRPVLGVNARIRKLGLSTRKSVRWTKSGLRYLKNNYKYKSVDLIAEELGRTISAIRGKAAILGVDKTVEWTAADEAYIREYYHKKPVHEMAKKFRCTRSAVMSKARKLGLTQRIPKVRWSQADLNFLRTNIQSMLHKDIAKILNRTTWSVSRKAFNMGLLKSRMADS